jgi:hypothetical protein
MILVLYSFLGVRSVQTPSVIDEARRNRKRTNRSRKTQGDQTDLTVAQVLSNENQQPIK